MNHSRLKSCWTLFLLQLFIFGFWLNFCSYFLTFSLLANIALTSLTSLWFSSDSDNFLTSQPNFDEELLTSWFCVFQHFSWKFVEFKCYLKNCSTLYYLLRTSFKLETWNSLEDKWVAFTDKKEKKIENKNLVRLKAGILFNLETFTTHQKTSVVTFILF